jgi:hypothetical protein
VILHSKTALIDGVWATVGSTNLDWRSFLHNHELNAVVLGTEFGDLADQVQPPCSNFIPDGPGRERQIAVIRDNTATLWMVARPIRPESFPPKRPCIGVPPFIGMEARSGTALARAMTEPELLWAGTSRSEDEWSHTWKTPPRTTRSPFACFSCSSRRLPC